MQQLVAVACSARDTFTGKSMCLCDAANLDRVSAPIDLSQVVGKLRPQPHLDAASKSLRETYRHFRRDATLSVDDVVERLPGQSQRASGLGNGEPLRFEPITPNVQTGMRW